MSIDGKARSGQSPGAERQHVDAFETIRKTFPVPFEHLVVSQQMMSKSYRLGALKVRVAGHNDVQILLGGIRQLLLEHFQVRDHEASLFPQKKTHIESDLIVAAACGVELLSRGADFFTQAPLDVHMD